MSRVGPGAGLGSGATVPASAVPNAAWEPGAGAGRGSGRFPRCAGFGVLSCDRGERYPTQRATAEKGAERALPQSTCCNHISLKMRWDRIEQAIPTFEK